MRLSQAHKEGQHGIRGEISLLFDSTIPRVNYFIRMKRRVFSHNLITAVWNWILDIGWAWPYIFPLEDY